ncbi:hypothetical protein GGF43_000759 [Coemansia sp. RSA 2618]|nr:hypothetical protein GGF43_000759 [Coemansia sp. RSA 2618]
MTLSKRAAATDDAGSKRARTAPEPKTHTAECHDEECTGCADGAVMLDPDVLELPAAELLHLAEQEQSARADRAVITKLYETALDACGSEPSLLRAQVLLRLAEYVGFVDYASEAIDVAGRVSAEASQAASEKDEGGAQALVVVGRARVLAVCLDRVNWADDQSDAESDAEDDAGAKLPPIAGDSVLRQGLREIIEALRIIAAPAATLATLESLLACHDSHSLLAPLRLATMDCALAISYDALGWDTTTAPVSDTNADLALGASKAAVYWAMAASECATEGSQIEDRIAPVVKYLAQTTGSSECCKLHAQLMLVLSGVLSDEDMALHAFDTAVEALTQAHQISPDDKDVVRQLEDLGVDV